MKKIRVNKNYLFMSYKNKVFTILKPEIHLSESNSLCIHYKNLPGMILRKKTAVF